MSTAINKTNYWEDVIDQMMIDEVSGLDADIKATLEGLDQAEQRLAILSILDKNRGLYMSIHNIVSKNSVSKTEHIKELLKMLREYVKVGEIEKKLFGEVMTPISLVEEMLSHLPEEVWKNKDLKFLDPCNGVGIFPSVIVSKLMEGLSDSIPNEEERYKHIMENMLYVCELQPKNMFLYLCGFDPDDEFLLNIHCGSFLDKGFDDKMKEWGVKKFDIIVGNPPYQESVDNNNRMKPIYHYFVERSSHICDLLLLVTPSRWMGGGLGLSDFRKKMLARNDIKIMRLFENSKDVFGNAVDIKGGISYFLIDSSYDGKTIVNGAECKIGNFDVFVSEEDQNIVKIVKKFKSLSEICKTEIHFGFRTNDSRLFDTEFANSVQCYVSKKQGFIKYANFSDIKNSSDIKKWKIFTARAAGKGRDGFGNMFIGEAGTICSQSYISFFTNSESEAKSLLAYLKTGFANVMLSMRKITQDIKPDTCKWIPIIPLDREWTDESVFNYLELSNDDRAIILERASQIEYFSKR